MGDGPLDFFDESEFGSNDFTSPEDLFSILENLEDAIKDVLPFTPYGEAVFSPRAKEEPTALVVPNKSMSSSVRSHNETDEDNDVDDSPARKKPKTMSAVALMEAVKDGQQKISHITVERNRRKQMNDNLSVLRSLMPCFYVKRGDQASIIGGVVDYIKELQQLLQSLEAKKQRKAYSEVLSPRPASSPRLPPLSPRPSPLSPRVGLPISPRTPQPGSPYKPRVQQSYLSPTMAPFNDPPPSFDNILAAANSTSPVANVEVKFSGPNVLLKTVSNRIPGQAMKIMAALEGLSLEILHVSINTIDETMLNSFTIKIGIECELSAEELAQEIQQTFS